MKSAMVVLGILVAGIATATTVSEPWGPSNPGELNLYEIVNALYGTGFSSNTEMEFAQLPADEIFTLVGTIKAEAKYADYSETIGWYQPTGSGSPAVFTDLFSVTGSGLAAAGSAVIDVNGSFGFYDLTGPASNPTQYRWYSEADENGGEDHMVTYDLGLLTGNAALTTCLLVGWEDNPFAVSDTDYQDAVLEISQVPEPATCLLLAMGLGALVARGLRHARR